MRKISLALTALLFILTTACFNEDDATSLAVFAEPSSYTVKSGEMIYIDVQATTLNSTLTEISVTSFDSEHGKSEIYKTNPGSKNFKERIVWEIPSMNNDSTILEILICATDDAGAHNDFKLKLQVSGGNSALLEERSGFTIYSPFSGKHDAFSFKTFQTLSSSIESEDCDLMFVPQNEGDTLPLQWGTATDLVFSKANNYDYASASRASLQSVFTNSLRSDSVSNLQIDDIILIGREQHPDDGDYLLSTLGVIKIMAIYDESGVQNDRIVFNLKAL